MANLGTLNTPANNGVVYAIRDAWVKININACVKSSLYKQTVGCTLSALTDTTGYLSGNTNVGGTLLPNMIVDLYYKPTWGFIQRTTTDVNGVFTFRYLETGKAYYTAIAHKPGYNTLIYDSLVPVAS